MIESIRNIDFLLSFIYLIIITIILVSLSRKYSDKNKRLFFLWGGIFKLIASQLYCFVYVYYYKFGDTIRFFRFGQMYKNLLFEIENLSFTQWLFMNNNEFTLYVLREVNYAYGFAESSFIVNKISAYLSFFTFNSFLVNTAIFSIASFSGIWKLYLSFTKLYPQLYKEFAISILFFPSIVFWGSGLMKDTICIGAIGWMTWAICNIFFFKEKLTVFQMIKNILLTLLCMRIILDVKTYILVSYMAGIFIWIFYSYRSKIKNDFVRVASTPILLGLGVGGVLIGLQFFSAELDKYALENVIDTALSLSTQIARLDAGSSYDLGVLEPSIAGLLKKMPAAINVTLFRPYLWEVNSVIMLFSALESFLTFLLTIYVFYKVGFFNSLQKILQNGTLLFCIIYSLFFGFAVGLSSQNFGTLVRYKVPIMPIYLSGIFILYYDAFGKSFIDSFRKKKVKAR